MPRRQRPLLGPGRLPDRREEVEAVRFDKDSRRGSDRAAVRRARVKQRRLGRHLCDDPHGAEWG